MTVLLKTLQLKNYILSTENKQRIRHSKNEREVCRWEATETTHGQSSQICSWGKKILTKKEILKSATAKCKQGQDNKQQKHELQVNVCVICSTPVY